jgi:hypothetical protein
VVHYRVHKSPPLVPSTPISLKLILILISFPRFSRPRSLFPLSLSINILQAIIISRPMHHHTCCWPRVQIMKLFIIYLFPSPRHPPSLHLRPNMLLSNQFPVTSTQSYSIIILSEILTEVTMKIAVFLDVTPCSFADIHQRFGGNC